MVKVSLAPITCLALLLALAPSVSAQGTRSSYFFAVSASDGQVDLGTWSKVTGLDVTWDLAEYRAGDQASADRRRIHPYVERGTITLHREVGADTVLVKEWLDRLAQTGERPRGTIELIDITGEVVARWTFLAGYPTKWQVSGPDGTGSKVSLETLVIEHEGLILESRRRLQIPSNPAAMRDMTVGSGTLRTSR
jgi:phage tail-like protein